ncbi:MAG: tetratricopeptide repeat protein [Ignavibacteriales bacterium]|nr:tetratricopeptide repeat protein [Ignavibacteriales bacterium]
MLRAKKKISQRVIKEDKIATTYFKTREWLEENRHRLSTIGIVVAVVIIGLWFYLNNVKTRNEKAASDFAKIFVYFDNGQYQIALNGIPERNVSGLQSIVDNGGSTTAGNVAKFYLASAYYNMQEYGKALQYFEDFSGSDPLLKVSAISGAAGCYEAKKDFKKAAEAFEKAASKNSEDPNIAENLSNAARNYAKAGEKQRAIDLLNKIKKEFPASAAARNVERYLAEINA